MKIGIDIQTAIGERKGVGTYVACLVEELARLEGEEEFRLLYFDFMRRGAALRVKNPRFARAPVRFLPGRIYQSLSETLGWPDFSLLFEPCDLYHFPNFTIPPLSRGRCVVTVCDISFIRYPEYAEPRNLRRLERGFRPALERSDAIITISGFSRDELVEACGVSREKIAVIPLGVRAGTGREGKRPLPFDYFIFVGTVEPRKNLGCLLEAWRIIKGRKAGDWRHKLVIAGAHGWRCPPAMLQAREKGLEKDVVVFDHATDEYLDSLYRGATALVFPSIYEGFGLPPLEAMARGTPVIASNAPAIPETVGDAALLCDPRDPEDFASTMIRMRDDAALRGSLVSRGFTRSALFDWRRTAEETLALYRKLLK